MRAARSDRFRHRQRIHGRSKWPTFDCGFLVTGRTETLAEGRDRWLRNTLCMRHTFTAQVRTVRKLRGVFSIAANEKTSTVARVSTQSLERKDAGKKIVVPQHG